MSVKCLKVKREPFEAIKGTLQIREICLYLMAVLEGKKMLDTGGAGPYATPSMRKPSSPTMLARATPVHSWTERGDHEDAGEEEGQGQEEEVGRPRVKGER